MPSGKSENCVAPAQMELINSGESLVTAFLTTPHCSALCYRRIRAHVVVLRGSGRDMVPVPEMAAFGERFGFEFVAHAIGNANRSARAERPFTFIEGNFLAGRTFSSWEDLNQRAREWCDKVNTTYKKHIRAVPRELFAVERLHLKPLPAWTPEVYMLQQSLDAIYGNVVQNTTIYALVC